VGQVEKVAAVGNLVDSLALQSPYLAPSWSWVGRGSVEFYTAYDRDFRQLCKISAYTQVDGENPFGRVVAGALFNESKIALLRSDLKRNSDPTLRRYARPWVATSAIMDGWSFYLDWNPSDDIQPCGKRKMILIGSINWGGSNGRRVYRLLVHEVGSLKPGEFCRVGLFKSSPGMDLTAEFGLDILPGTTVTKMI
jgi:hypothetical protein